jgi:hypothetical protein
MRRGERWNTLRIATTSVRTDLRSIRTDNAGGYAPVRDAAGSPFFNTSSTALANVSISSSVG